MTTPTILALDASSTMLGYCLYDGTVVASGEIALKHHDIAERCRLAFAQFNGLLGLYPLPDVVAIESPAIRRFKAPDGRRVDTMNAVMPQCHVQGALMCAASLQGILIVQIEPATAKKALSGKGNADKHTMQRLAWERYGVRGEHAADALAVALAAVPLVSVERQAA